MLLLGIALIAAPVADIDPCQATDSASLAACAQTAFKGADKELNHYYKTALGRLQKEGQTKAASDLIRGRDRGYYIEMQNAQDCMT